MPNASKPTNNIAKAIRLVRKSKGLSQEDFGLVSSRTYVSSVERKQRFPTLNKIDDLAAAMEVHPLTLLALAYLDNHDPHSIGVMLERVAIEILEIE